MINDGFGKVKIQIKIKAGSTQTDRARIKADGKDLSCVTLKVTDDRGNPVPDADWLISYKLTRDALLAGVDAYCPPVMNLSKEAFIRPLTGLCLRSSKLVKRNQRLN